jgi:hypothetical protein
MENRRAHLKDKFAQARIRAKQTVLKQEESKQSSPPPSKHHRKKKLFTSSGKTFY